MLKRTHLREEQLLYSKMNTAHTAEPYNECVRIVHVPYDNTTSTTCMIDFLVIVN